MEATTITKFTLIAQERIKGVIGDHLDIPKDDDERDYPEDAGTNNLVKVLTLYAPLTDALTKTVGDVLREISRTGWTAFGCPYEYIDEEVRELVTQHLDIPESYLLGGDDDTILEAELSFSAGIIDMATALIDAMHNVLKEMQNEASSVE